MKALALLMGVGLSTSALATVKVGNYTGKLDNGEACVVSVSEVKFEGVRHPLNERVLVSFNGEAFTLQHPPMIKVEDTSVMFDHDQLAAAKGVAGGGMGAVMKMEHSENGDGPKSFTFMHHDYKSPEKSVKAVCNDLVFSE